MGIFRRVNDIISANLNDLVDKFEDPEKMLKQAIREMETSIEDVTGAAAKAIASERLLAKDLAGHESEANHWRERAEAAVKANDDELARQSLRRKREHSTLALALRDQASAAGETSQTLRRQIDAMKAKHAEAKRKLATLSARSKAAHARRRLHAVSASVAGSIDAFSRFDRLQERVEESEAEADAWLDLHTSPSEKLATEITDRADDASIEAELTAIKSRFAG